MVFAPGRYVIHLVFNMELRGDLLVGGINVN